MRATTLDDLRDDLLVWLASASALPLREVLPTFRWLCEERGCSFEQPTAAGLCGVIESLRSMALAGGSPQRALEAQIAPFRSVLADL